MRIGFTFPHKKIINLDKTYWKQFFRLWTIDSVALWSWNKRNKQDELHILSGFYLGHGSQDNTNCGNWTDNISLTVWRKESLKFRDNEATEIRGA